MRISYGPGIKGLTSLLSFDDCTNHPNLCQDKGKALGGGMLLLANRAKLGHLAETVPHSITIPSSCFIGDVSSVCARGY